MRTNPGAGVTQTHPHPPRVAWPCLASPSLGFLGCQAGTMSPHFCTIMGISGDGIGDTAPGTWLAARPALTSREEDRVAGMGEHARGWLKT